MATQRKATPPKKAAAKKEPVKKAEEVNEQAPVTPAAIDETPSATAEQPPQEGAENAGAETGGGAAEVSADAPPYELKPEEQTPEQKAYVAEHNRYLDLHGELPLNTLDTASLKALNDQKQEELDNPPKPPVSAVTPELKPEEKPAAAKATLPANKVRIVNQKTGEKKTVNKITWDILKKSPQGWKEAPDIPAEVQALQKGGR